MARKQHPSQSISTDLLSPHIPVMDKVATLAMGGERDRVAYVIAGKQLKQLLALASAHTSQKSGHLVLDEKPLLAREIAPADIVACRRNLEVANRLIDEKALVLDRRQRLRSNSPLFLQGRFYKRGKWEASADVYWWGVELCMNSELTWVIIASLLAGAGAAAILALIEASSVVGVAAVPFTAFVAAMIALGAIALMVADQGDGVCIRILFVPPGLAVVVPR